MTWRRLLAATGLALAITACGSVPAPGQGPRHAHQDATPARYALPDRSLTPGAAGSDLARICPTVSPALERARPSDATKTRVYAAYRISTGQRHLYVIDHDVPLALDGQNVTANLWPQPSGEARQKDRVEVALHRAVCSGRIPLATAQRAISIDWATALTVLRLTP